MKKSLLLFLLLFLAAGVMQSQVTIYGYRNWQQSNPESCKKGPVKFSSATPGTVTLIADQTSLGSVYASTYFNYKWYGQVTKYGTQSSVEGLYTIDMETGERTLVSKSGFHLSEMTMDYTTGTVYGIASSAKNLATINLTTGETATVGAFSGSTETIYMLALACHKDGRLFGISTDDNLWLIDKATAACTLVGSTGVNAAFTQSMDFDRNSGVLYWANCGDYKLYTVDITTGKATLIGGVGENGDDSLSGIFVPYIDVPAGAPDRVTARKAVASGSSVTLTWTNPSTDAQGNPLGELGSVKIMRDGNLLKEVTVDASKIGASMEYVDADAPTGLRSYSFIPVNSKGEGGEETDDVTVSVGENAPGAVGSFTVTTGDNTATLAWTAPTEGMYGGEYNPANVVKYVIVRSSDSGDKKIEVTDPSATSYTDTPGFGTYTYSIYAVNGIGDGVKTTAEPVTVKPADWIVMADGEAVVENGKTYKFYDNAGPGAYYTNSQNLTLTIRPATPESKVMVAFKSMEVEEYDNITVYNGPNTDAPKIGEYTGPAVPADLLALESSSKDGSLTFVFFSDMMSRMEGWEADVTAVKKKQQDLAAVSLTGDKLPAKGAEAAYQVGVMNKGVKNIAAGDYKVVLKDGAGVQLAEAQGPAVETMATVSVELKFTPTTVADMVVKAEIVYAADEDSSNNESETLGVSVLAEGSRFVEAGDPSDQVLVVPISFMGEEAISEIIYYKEEIGLQSGRLKMIGYDYSSVGTNYKDVPVRIWVGETEKTDLAEGAIPASELTLVFDGTIDVTQGDTEMTYQFAEPYEYKGGNLVVMIHKKSVGTTSYDVGYKGTFGKSGEPQRSRFDSTFDASETLDPNATEMGYSAGTIWPFTKMLFIDAVGGVNMVEIGEPVRLYPNPVVDRLAISGDVATIEMFDFSGRKVYEAGKVTSIDMGAYPSGIYLVKATTAEGRMVVKKVVKK